MNIFLDMDGVLTDFEGSFKKLSNGVPPSKYEYEKGAGDFWSLIGAEGEEFWSEMPWKSDGKELWSFCVSTGYPVSILSAPSRDKRSVTGKIKWIKRELGLSGPVALSPKKWSGEKIILNSEKYRFCRNEDDILIDDTSSKIEKWIGAGGIGILHVNTQTTIRELEDYL